MDLFVIHASSCIHDHYTLQSCSAEIPSSGIVPLEQPRKVYDLTLAMSGARHNYPQFLLVALQAQPIECRHVQEQSILTKCH